MKEVKDKDVKVEGFICYELLLLFIVMHEPFTVIVWAKHSKPFIIDQTYYWTMEIHDWTNEQILSNTDFGQDVSLWITKLKVHS